MKEFNKLIEYRSYYEYDFNCEALRVNTGEDSDEAKKLYSHLVRDYFLEADDKWAFDIALDCVHNFTDEEIEIIQRQEEIFDYHFGYGLYVRNHYVYPSKCHIYFMADYVSSRVEAFIYTILMSKYNCLSKEYMKLISNYTYSDLKELYGKEHPIITQVADRLSDMGTKETAEEAMKALISSLRESLGYDYLKEQVSILIKKYIDHKDLIAKDNFNFVNALYKVTRVFEKEYHQIVMLRELGLFSDLKNIGITVKYPTVDSLFNFISEGLGFKEEDSQFLADCLWNAFEDAKQSCKTNIE